MTSMYTIRKDKLVKVDVLETFRFMGRDWFIFPNNYSSQRRTVAEVTTGGALHPCRVQNKTGAKRYLKEIGKKELEKNIERTAEYIKSLGLLYPINPSRDIAKSDDNPAELGPKSKEETI